MNKLRSNLLLLLVAMIWGAAFVAQSSGMDYIGPWTFTCVRCLLASIVSLLLIPCMNYITRRKASPFDKTTVVGGILCGLVLAPATMFQQIGLQYTTVGKAGFITALYCIIVPFFAIFLHKKVSRNTWFATFIAIIGFYFLCMTDSFSLSTGDAYMLISAVLFAGHILVIDHYAPIADGSKMSFIQFLVVFFITLGPTLLLEKPTLSSIFNAGAPILYAGILSNGVGYTLQIIGQRNADPTAATLILSLESVFAVIAGFLFLNQTMSIRELFGCLLVFIGVIFAQLPEKKL